MDYEERAKHLADLNEEKRLLTELIRANLDTESDLLRLESVLDEVERIERVHRGEDDVLYFGMEYFSEDGNPGNADNMIPAGTNYYNSADFHRELAGMLSDVSSGRKRRNISWACPRGSAKTAWISNIFLTHQVVYRKKKYIVLFSQTTDVAGDFISWGKFQMKLNDKLRTDFGELLDVRPSMNELDNKYEFITKSGTKVEAKGLGTQTRGLRHGKELPPVRVI